MTSSLRIAPPNSLILVMDPRAVDIPQSFDQEIVSVTKSCLAIGTLSASDGETEIALCHSSEYSTARTDSFLAWTGTLKTKGALAVMTCMEEILLQKEVTKKVKVQVWINDESEPDSISIVYS